jgi:asparagine synthase (glutamine-hydrolysing)
MSGILGFVGHSPRPFDIGRLGRAMRLLEDRGLNHQELLLFDRSRHSRLSLDAVSQQSYFSHGSHSSYASAIAMLVQCHVQQEGHASSGADDRVFLSCDGVIDNRSELVRELKAVGYELTNTSQSEVLRAAFDQWGADCLSRLTGSFACAVLDFRRRSLILARDAFGTRPLYYARENGWGLFFASQITALLEVASFARKVNRASLYRYLAYNMMEHGAQTFFAGVEQLSPGHYLEVPLEQPTQSSLIRYRRVVSAPTKLTFDEAVEHLRQLVIRAVASQAGVHNDVGAALSGGFDSSFVVAAFERVKPGAPLALYTCVPIVKGGTFTRSEEAWADLAAAGLRGPVNKVRVPAGDLPASFASLVRLHEEPFSSPVVFAQLQVFRAAQEDGVRVMLSGQGGDTIFATSSDQLLSAVRAQVRHRQWRTAAAILRAGGQLPGSSIRGLAVAAARIVLPEGWQAFARRLRRPVRLDWLKEEWFELDAVGRPDDFGLPMLRLEDRNSLACSILNRMPLLTPELQDFVRSLPAEYLVTPNQPMKSIESAAMRGLVPNTILARRERSGFPVPIREWLGELAPWVDMNITELERFPFFEPRRVRQIWERVQSRDKSMFAAFLVWRWVFLAGWMRVFNVSLD